MPNANRSWLDLVEDEDLKTFIAEVQEILRAIGTLDKADREGWDPLVMERINAGENLVEHATDLHKLVVEWDQRDRGDDGDP